MIEVFQPVLYVRVPLHARIRLRPKVRLFVGAAELNRNEMVDLAALGHVAVAMMLAAGNAIGVRRHCPCVRRRHWPRGVVPATPRRRDQGGADQLTRFRCPIGRTFYLTRRIGGMEKQSTVLIIGMAAASNTIPRLVARPRCSLLGSRSIALARRSIEARTNDHSTGIMSTNSEVGNNLGSGRIASACRLWRAP